MTPPPSRRPAAAPRQPQSSRVRLPGCSSSRSEQQHSLQAVVFANEGLGGVVREWGGVGAMGLGIGTHVCLPRTGGRSKTTKPQTPPKPLTDEDKKVKELEA